MIPSTKAQCDGSSVDWRCHGRTVFSFCLTAPFSIRLSPSCPVYWCAIHPFWIIDTATLADGTTASFLLALALFLGGRSSQTSGPLGSLLYGLSLAALALVRAALLPFAFVALAWFLWRSRILAHGWLWALLAFLGFVIGLAPWTVRNWQLHDSLLPIVDSAYYHLWIGNKPPGDGDAHKVRGASADEHVARLNAEPALDHYYAKEIWQEICEHPTETVRRRLQSGLYFLFGEHWFTKGHRLADSNDSEEAMPDWLARTYPVALEGTMLVLVLLGMLGWRWTYGWRFRAMPSSLALFWSRCPTWVSHAETLSGPRLPLDGVLLCYAAFALACLLPGGGLLRQGEPIPRIRTKRSRDRKGAVRKNPLPYGRGSDLLSRDRKGAVLKTRSLTVAAQIEENDNMAPRADHDRLDRRTDAAASNLRASAKSSNWRAV